MPIDLEIEEEITPSSDIITRPRLTFRWLIANDSTLVVTLFLVYVAGVYYGLGQAEANHVGDRKSILSIISAALLISGLGGLITFNILIWIIDFCASWFGGRGNFRKTLIAFGWSSVPSVAGLFLVAIGYLLFEDELFTTDTSNIESNSFLNSSFLLYTAMKWILAIWHLVLLVIGISEVQRLSILKSIFTLLTSTAFIISVVWIFVALIV